MAEVGSVPVEIEFNSFKIGFILLFFKEFFFRCNKD